MSTDKETAFLSYDGLTDPLGRSQILPYVDGLSKKGWKIHLITFEKKPVPTEFKKEIAYKKINWIPLSYHKTPPILSTLYDLKDLEKTLEDLISKHSILLIHSRGLLPHLIGEKVAQKNRLKIIWDIRGFYADERLDGNLWNRRNPIYNEVYKYFKKREWQALRESDQIISLTHSAKKEMLEWASSGRHSGSKGYAKEKGGIENFNLEKISVIPTCVDNMHFDPRMIFPEDKKNLKADLQFSPCSRVMGYVGSWGTWYLTNEMMDLFRKLEEKDQSLSWLILSNSKPETVISDLRSHWGQNFWNSSQRKIKVLSVRREDMPLYMSVLDFGVFFIKDSFSKKASAATKLGEFSAMQIPVVSNPGWGDIDSISKKYPQLLHLENPKKPNSDSILNWLTLPKENLDSYAQKEISLKKAVEDYHSVYSKLLSS